MAYNLTVKMENWKPPPEFKRRELIFQKAKYALKLVAISKKGSRAGNNLWIYLKVAVRELSHHPLKDLW